MKYYTSTHQDLLDVSAYMQQVTRPNTVNDNDVTKYRYNIIKHPTLEQHALVIDENDSINIHPAVKAMANTPVSWPPNAIISDNADAQAKRNFVKSNSHAGGVNLVPARLTEKTLAEMTNEGWFNYPEP